jgi:hypothetical protein
MTLKAFPRKKMCENDASMDEFTRMFNYLSLKKKNQINVYDSNSCNFPWNEIGNSHKRQYDKLISSKKSKKPKHVNKGS